MPALHKLTAKTPCSSSLRYITSRFLTTQNPIPEKPTPAGYDDLINAAGRNRDFATVHRLLNKRIRDGCFNTNNTFKFISTDPDLSVLDDLLHTLSSLDRNFSRKSAFDSLVARLCKLNRTDHALHVLDMILREGYGANASTFHPLLNSLTRKKNMDEAWRVMDLMRHNDITPDVTAYNYIMTAYCFAGDLTSAAALLTRMEEEEGMAADTRTYDALVLGACRAGKVEGALVVLRRMEDDGVPPLYSTHAHVIGGLLKTGCYAQAMEFVMSCAGRYKGLDMESFGLLANRLIQLRRFDEAVLVLEEMRNRGLAMGDKLKDFCLQHIKD